MNKPEFPAAYTDMALNLVVINVAMIPIAAGVLGVYESEDSWLTREDYGSGYPAIAELQRALADMTFILPVARGGTGVSKIPAFFVHKNGVNQTGFVTNTYTKVTLTHELFDTNNNFASSRFTPTVAGIYMVSAATRAVAGSLSSTYLAIVYKNGVEAVRGALVGSNGASPFVTGLISMNGSTDYLELYFYQSSGVNGTVEGYATMTFLSGVWVGPL